MTIRRQIRGTDIAIFISFPAAAVLFCFFLLIHRSMGSFAAMLVIIGFLIGSASFILLPLWVVLHIVFNRGRSSVQVLWIESGLAGVWLALGLWWLLPEWVGGTLNVLIAGLAGGAVALTPYTMCRLRSSSGRTPTG